MHNDTSSFLEFESQILVLDPLASDCRVKISDLRKGMDVACDVGTITLKQWRLLLDRIAAIQAKCPTP